MTINIDGSIKAISYGRVTQKAPWHTGRKLNTNLLVYVDVGRLKMEVGKEVYSLKKGDILCIPENTFYRPVEASALEYYFIHFTAVTDEASANELHFRANPLLPEGDYEYSYWGGAQTVTLGNLIDCSSNEAVKNIFRRIAALNIRSIGEKLILDCLVRELIVTVCAENNPKGRLNNNMMRITSYIDLKYYEDITLSSLSEKFGFSKSYIARLFKTELGTTSAAYLNRTRVANACRLLLCSNKNIGEISEAVGYNNQYYFTKIFKKEMGLTPGEYKKRNLTA